MSSLSSAHNTNNNINSNINSSAINNSANVTNNIVSTSSNTHNSNMKDVTKIRLHVSNIPYDLRWQDLKDLFKEKVGSDVCYVEIYEGIDGKSTGSGVIEIKGRDLADRAIELLHKTELKNRQIIVREEKEKDRQQYNKLQNPSSSMGMDHNNINGSTINNTNNSLSIGLQLLCQLGIDTENITNQIFIANLDYNVTSKKLKDVFIMAGSILQVDLKVDKEGSSRGMATIRYESPIEAVQAITMFNGQYLYERQMNVRMDKMSESSQQFIPNILPAGLKGVGFGLGVGGQPLLNVGHIANALVLSQLISLTASGKLFSGFLNSSTIPASLRNNANNLGQLPMSPMPPRTFNPLLQNTGALLANLNNNNGNSNIGNSYVSGTGSGLNGSNNGCNNGFNLLSELRSYGWSNGPFSMGGPRLPNSYHPGSYALNGSYYPHHQHHHHHSQHSYGQRHGESGTVIVKNLPYSTTWQHLKDKFKEAGDIQYVDIKMENGKSKGIGSVRFSNVEDARRAISLMNGLKMDGRQIEVKFEI